jgi:hypothetical protein
MTLGKLSVKALIVNEYKPELGMRMNHISRIKRGRFFFFESC